MSRCTMALIQSAVTSFTEETIENAANEASLTHWIRNRMATDES